MRLLHPVLLAIWSLVISIVIVGPLGSLIYDEYKNTQLFLWLEGILRSHAIVLSGSLAVLALLTFWSHFHQPPPAQPSAKLVPHQLPPLPPDFTGRGQEVNELVRAVQKRRVTTLAVRGMGGIGKTTVAIKVANTLARHFPDGEIYLDLKGIPRTDGSSNESRPLAAGEAMDHVIRSFNREAPVSPNDGARAADYFTALNGKRVLLLMDNALDAQQVKKLIPPLGSVLIVTSQQRFHLPGAERLDLDRLPPKDACKLLLAIAPAIGLQAGDLASLCDYVPEDLRHTASTIAEIPDGLSDFLRRMNDPKYKLEITGVGRSLNASAEMLSEDLRDLWLQLGVFPDTFDVPAVIKVLQIEEQAAKDTLGDLRRRSLIEWNSATRRYKMADRVRDFTFSRLDESARTMAQARHADYYRLVMIWAENLSLTGKVSEGLALFDLEWSNLRVGQSWAASRVKSDKSAAELVSAYAYGVPDHFVRKRPRELIGWLHSAQEAAKELKNAHNEGVALHGLGAAYEALADYEQSIKYYEEYLALERDLRVPILEGAALINIAVVSRKTGRVADAIRYGEEALKVYEKIQTPLADDLRDQLAKWRSSAVEGSH
jgi:hypothetical protein